MTLLASMSFAKIVRRIGLRTKKNCPACRVVVVGHKEVPSFLKDPEAWFDYVDVDKDRVLSSEELDTAFRFQLKDGGEDGNLYKQFRKSMFYIHGVERDKVKGFIDWVKFNIKPNKKGKPPPDLIIEKKEEEVWACPMCTLHNPIGSSRCKACSLDKPGSKRSASRVEIKEPEQVGEWKSTKDERTGRTYYWNTVTREVSWTKPKGGSTTKPKQPSLIQQQGLEWSTAKDSKTGRLYYWNVRTREVTWKKPAALIKHQQVSYDQKARDYLMSWVKANDENNRSLKTHYASEWFQLFDTNKSNSFDRKQFMDAIATTYQVKDKSVVETLLVLFNPDDHVITKEDVVKPYQGIFELLYDNFKGNLR